tara:strand:- start:972 stop:1265 length:294 start_codon:yes stop_codon:yes gene_type:complete
MKVIRRGKVKIPYVNAKGEEKNDWVDVGSLWKSDDGSVWFQMNALPLHSQNWDGRISLFPTEENERKQAKEGIEQAKKVLAEDDIRAKEIPEDAIPF